MAKVYKYGDNVDTDVIIPARYLNAPEKSELAKHCMEDIDLEFAKTVQPGDLLWQVPISAAVLPGSMPQLPFRPVESNVSSQRVLRVFFTAMPLISVFRLWNALKQRKTLKREMRSVSTFLPV